MIFLLNGSYCDNFIILVYFLNDKKEKLRFIKDICVGFLFENVLIVFKLILSFEFVFIIIVFYNLRENVWKIFCSLC